MAVRTDAQGCASAANAQDGCPAATKVSTRVLVLGGTVIALVLAETIYIGRTAGQIMPVVAPVSAHHKRAIDRTFTLMPSHAPTHERVSRPPLRPTLGIIERA